VIGEVIALAGAVLVLLAAIGVLRFPDALSRMQSLTKASTVGLALVALGSVFVLPTWNDDTSAIAAALMQVVTLPIGASLLARATYRATPESGERDHADRGRRDDGETGQ
jgi:multicomponent Na+:H+ antiporter subunit G